jgi:hypothetical protein
MNHCEYSLETQFTLEVLKVGGGVLKLWPEVQDFGFRERFTSVGCATHRACNSSCRECCTSASMQSQYCDGIMYVLELQLCMLLMSYY